MKLPVREFDAVVIGAGGAGMRAALQISQSGQTCALLSKVFPTRSHTVSAQGGITVALGNTHEDNWEWHMYDTVKGSDYIGDQDAIEYMCKTGPEAILELEHMGLPFSRLDDGRIYQRPFGGQSKNFGGEQAARTAAAADRTGHALLHTLYQQNLKNHTTIFSEWYALDLVKNQDGAVVGCTALCIETGEVVYFKARATVLATGGAGRIYQSTTNAHINTGDGVGMAIRAGVPVQDMEMWQFHPTGIFPAGILVTEGCRGDGGLLRDVDGHRFMPDVEPEKKELRLSECFKYSAQQSDELEQKEMKPCLELTATMLNINIGNNEELMKKCNKLYQYSEFVRLVRKHLKKCDINAAINLAIDEAISNNILKDILQKQRAEVCRMILTEYNEELHMKNERKIAIEEGYKEGYDSGYDSGFGKAVDEMIDGFIKDGETKEQIIEKLISYFKMDKEENPALGYRAIRICLTRPEIFKTQLRALFRASAYGNLAIMYPMITSLWEVKRIKEIVEEVKAELTEEQLEFGNPQQGIMIETPAAVMMSGELAKEVDFFSIGTNDLTQYTLAIDRQNPKLDKFYDAHHPAVLSMIRMTVENAHKAGIWAGICGELGADTSLTKEFLAMGVDELSVSPGSILPIRKIILETDTENR